MQSELACAVKHELGQDDELILYYIFIGIYGGVFYKFIWLYYSVFCFRVLSVDVADESQRH